MICLIPDCLVIIYNNYRPVRIMRRNEETRQYTNNSTNDNTNDNTENVLLQAYIYIYIYYNIHSNKSIFQTNDNEPM